MNDEAKYLFDLQGYITVPKALTKPQLRALNRILDQQAGEPDEPDFQTRRFKDLLDWGKPYRNLIDNPRITPYLEAIIGPRIRLDHIYADIIRGGLSPIGANLHGGGAPFAPSMYYRFQDGRMYNGLVVVAYNLHDVGPDDGGFACVPGSHKANFPIPSGMKDMRKTIHPAVKRVTGPAGTAILFTEALTHGPLPWTGAHERRTVFYKYSPAPVSWSAEYFDASRYPGLTPKQREFLEPPNNRYKGRPTAPDLS